MSARMWRISCSSCSRLPTAAATAIIEQTVRNAQRGIIYIDEIDKISAQERKPVHHARCERRGRAAGAAKILEGTVANVPPQGGRKHPQQEYVQLDTTNILFICGGAFEGLADIIERRINTRSMGIRASVAEQDRAPDAEAAICSSTSCPTTCSSSA